MGSSLDSLSDQTHRLKDNCQVLVDASSGQSNSSILIKRAAKALEAPIQYIGSSIYERQSTCSLLSNCEKSATKLLQRQNDMNSALQPLKFMLVFFKIEAAQLCAEDQATFKSVSEEISRLHKLVDDTFGKNMKQLEAARAATSEAEKQANQQTAKQAEEIEKKQQDLAQTIDRLNQQIEKNQLEESDLNSATGKFESAIGRLIMSLQYEDIFRQRCETILQAFDELKEENADRAWILVQAKQIETAAKELRESAEETLTGLDSISQQAKELYRISATMDQFEHNTASADGMVQTLLEAFESIRDILKKNKALAADSKTAIKPVQNLTEDLSAVVFEVSMNIQFIALNAQIRSIQVGAGSGLEILAARTAEISSELRELGDTTSAQITELHQTVNSLTRAIETDFEGVSHTLDELDESSQKIEAELHDLRDGALNSLSLIADMLGSVESLITGDRNKLTRISSIADTLEDRVAELVSQAKLQKLSAKDRALLEEEVEQRLQKVRGAMHTRVPTELADTDSMLAISEKQSSRRESAVSLSCDNIELF
ncbi:hypothetical protein VDG1235_2858 [Verrucomicrobiia bacterium DG1235]|nr:hypothetical protein VDG1235_2858 [Verrucomicrobiae bacterium DG1235]